MELLLRRYTFELRGGPSSTHASEEVDESLSCYNTQIRMQLRHFVCWIEDDRVTTGKERMWVGDLLVANMERMPSLVTLGVCLEVPNHQRGARMRNEAEEKMDTIVREMAPALKRGKVKISLIVVKWWEKEVEPDQDEGHEERLLERLNQAAIEAEGNSAVSSIGSFSSVPETLTIMCLDLSHGLAKTHGIRL